VKNVIRWVGFALCASMAAEEPAQAVKLRSGAAQTALLELYTSEGCSSCPPAEAWLSTLTAKQGLWTRFVPVAFHVDYWDYLGWKDELALPRSAVRQRTYASAWNSESIYTPEFILGGREWRGWSRGTVPEGRGGNAGVLEAVANPGGEVNITFAPSAPQEGELEAHAVWLECGVVRRIGGGENAGRTLTHDFVPVNWSTAALHRVKSGEWTGSAQLPRPGRANGRLALAVWVSGKGRPTPIQAAGGWAP
jgi:hypothetical protein